jgi:HTH-type transcriptional regulator/antitoxin HigA
MTTMTAYDSLLLEHRPRPIRNESAYKRMLGQVDQLMTKPRPSDAERDLVELLSTLIVQYESEVYPTPQVTPGEMLAHLIDARGVSKAQLAREVGIPRSTITNVVNGNRGLSRASAAKLGAYFHVSPVAFISGGE